MDEPLRVPANVRKNRHATALGSFQGSERERLAGMSRENEKIVIDEALAEFFARHASSEKNKFAQASTANEVVEPRIDGQAVHVE